MKKVIFVDRDGTIIREPSDEQVDSLEKLEFVPGAISALKALTGKGYELVLATNQDGLGTDSFPEDDFYPAHNKMLATLAGEGVKFDDELIDRTFPSDNAPTRKPGTGMFGKYLSREYDLASSFVIGDRETDMKLAENLGARGLLLGSWEEVVKTILSSGRCVTIQRKTSETEINLTLDLDGHGLAKVDTGLKFLDHMLDQLPHHGGVGLELSCKGDIEVDEHHTMEDVALALGEAFKNALGDKAGIERYGFALPMDESRCIFLIDFGGRSELVWNVNFTREYVGDVPTEMFKHFFKAFCNAAACNIYVEAHGENNHHIAEAIFKAFAKSILQAVRKNIFDSTIPSSKGAL